MIIGFLAFLFNYFFLIFFFVSILADSNRVPYDLAECESELVAGFITEYSTIGVLMKSLSQVFYFDND